MEKWGITGAFVLIVVLLGVWALYSYKPTSMSTNAANPTVDEFSYSPDTSSPLMVTENAAGSTYTFSGSIPTVATCEGISSELSNSGGNITLTLRLLYNGGPCAAATAATPAQKFSLSYTAPDGVTPTLSEVYVNETSVPFEVQ